MKVLMKPLRGELFELETAPWEKVKNLRKKVAEMDIGFTVEQLKFVFQGTILNDDSTLLDHGIKDGDFIVITAAKRKPPATSENGLANAMAPTGVGPEATTPTVAGGSSMMDAAAKPKPTPPTVRNEETTPGSVAAVTMSTPKTPTDLTSSANGLTAASTQASSQSPELDPMAAMFAALQSVQAAQGGQALMQQPTADFISAEDEAVIDRLANFGFDRQRAYDVYLACQKQEELAASCLLEDLERRNEGTQEVVLEPSPWLAPPKDKNEDCGSVKMLEQLKNDPNFKELARVVSQNPQMLNQMVQALAATDPNMAHAISENPGSFMRMAQETATGPSPVSVMLAAAQQATAATAQMPTPQPGDGLGGAAGQLVTVPLTANDEAAVQRLADLGFDRQLACEAYLVCGKNEDLAASCLFDDTDLGAIGGVANAGYGLEVQQGTAPVPAHASARWACYERARHYGDDLPGSGCQMSIEEAILCAEESPHCVGFTFDRHVTPPTVWFHAAVLDGDCLAGQHEGFDLYVHAERLADAKRQGQGTLPLGYQQISLTPADQSAIQRLTALGFNQETAHEAYLACGRNEELAGAYLFSDAEDFYTG